jgi:hypothetical protein
MDEDYYSNNKLFLGLKVDKQLKKVGYDFFPRIKN